MSSADKIKEEEILGQELDEKELEQVAGGGDRLTDSMDQNGCSGSNFNDGKADAFS